MWLVVVLSKSIRVGICESIRAAQGQRASPPRLTGRFFASETKDFRDSTSTAQYNRCFRVALLGLPLVTEDLRWRQFCVARPCQGIAVGLRLSVTGGFLLGVFRVCEGLVVTE